MKNTNATFWVIYELNKLKMSFFDANIALKNIQWVKFWLSAHRDICSLSLIWSVGCSKKEEALLQTSLWFDVDLEEVV